MSDKPRYSDFEDERTAIAAQMDQHPAHTDPFVPQCEPSVIPSAELSSEATMVVEAGPDLSSEATMVHDSLANPLAPLAKFVVLVPVGIIAAQSSWAADCVQGSPVRLQPCAGCLMVGVELGVQRPEGR